MTIFNRDYVTAIHIKYVTGDEFLLTDTLLNVFGQVKYRKTKLCGTRMYHLKLCGDYPISVDSDIRDMFRMLDQIKHPCGSTMFGIPKETKAEALVGIIPSGDCDVWQQQLIAWERERGWKRDETRP